MAGKFITFEGIEGCGKSTQIRLLDETLRQKGFQTVLTREPGGPAIGEAIRKILLNPKFKEMQPMTELLLYVANRAQHIEEVIKLAIAAGKIVLCDRYADSTTAYQGVARAISKKTLKEIHKIATNDFQPDLTILLDLPVPEGLKRIRRRQNHSQEQATLDRFEKETMVFHEKVRQGYLTLAKEEPKRIKIIDASKTSEEIHQQIFGEVKKVLK